MRNVYSSSFGTLKNDYVIKIKEMFSFASLINNSVATVLIFLLLSTSAITSPKKKLFYVFYLGCILLCFYKHYPYYLSIQ